MTCLVEDKECIGCSQSHLNSGPCHVNSPPKSHICEDKGKSVRTLNIDTGNSWLYSEEKCPSEGSNPFLAPPAMESCQEAQLLTNMFGRKTRISKEPGLNLESNLSEETPKSIGSGCGSMLSEEMYCQSLPMYEFSITAHSARSLRTLANHILWNDLVLYSLDLLELENLGAPGKRPLFTLTLKIRDPSSGMVTEVKNMLLLVCLINLDEFRGGIDISHVLRWLDRYPVLVEIKGSSTPLVAKKIWITSNLHPAYWYPDLDNETRNALLRRLEITEFQ